MIANDMKISIFITIAFLFYVTLAQSSANEKNEFVLNNDKLIFKSNPRVIDGDTLDAGGTLVEMHGIVAPSLEHESAQKYLCKDLNGKEWACGNKAKEVLAKLIGKNAVICIVCKDCQHKFFSKTPYFEWMAATCWSEEVESRDFTNSLNAEMIKLGYAFSWPYTGHYAEIEKTSRESCNGIYSGYFMFPWIWDTGFHERIKLKACSL